MQKILLFCQYRDNRVKKLLKNYPIMDRVLFTGLVCLYGLNGRVAQGNKGTNVVNPAWVNGMQFRNI